MRKVQFDTVLSKNKKSFCHFASYAAAIFSADMICR
jgi:hypothetical protein